MQQFKILVGAVPVSRGRVLVLQRSMREKFMPGAWGLPCGKIDFGEDLADAVLRELKEEAGIAGRVARLVGYSSFFSAKDEVDLHNVQINFLVDALSENVQLDRSNDDYRWIDLGQLDDAGLDEFTLGTIRQAL